MYLLFLSLIPLMAAPLLHYVMESKAKLRIFTSRALIIAVAALIVGHILPESYEVIGWYAILLAVLGLVIPSSLERMWVSEKWAIHAVPVWFMIAGLALHGLMDGAGIAAPELHHHGHHHGHSHSLPMAVLLHRLPVGLMIWGVFFPNHGFKLPTLYLSAIGLSTIAGYALSHYYLVGHSPSIAAVEAVVAGALLHIAFDRHEDGAACHAHHHPAKQT